MRELNEKPRSKTAKTSIQRDAERMENLKNADYYKENGYKKMLMNQSKIDDRCKSALEFYRLIAKK